MSLMPAQNEPTNLDEIERRLSDTVDLARLIALVDAGQVSPEQARPLAERLRILVSQKDVESSDVHLAERHDLLGGPLSQSEELALLFRLGTRWALLSLMQANYRLREAVLRFCEAHRDVIYIHGNHGEPSEPSTFGHWALMADSALARDSERMVALYGRINRSPAGAQAGNGVEFPLNRLLLADLLGFDGLVENTFDAAQSHDLIREWASTLAIWSQNLAGIVDVVLEHAHPNSRRLKLPLWAMQPNLIVAERAPIELQAVHRLAVRTSGLLTSLLTSESRMSSYLERSNNQRELNDLCLEFETRIDVLSRLFDELKPIQSPSEAGYRTPPPELTGLLQKRSGLSWTSSTLLINAAFRELEDRSEPLEALKPADILRAAANEGLPAVNITEEELRTVLSPKHFIASRNTTGGPGPDSMKNGLVSAHARIRLGRNRLEERKRNIDAASQRLYSAVTALLDVQNATP